MMITVTEDAKLNKVTKAYREDGCVGVLYSPGYGAGWSTWNWAYPDMVFDASIVYMVEEMNKCETPEQAEAWVQNIMSYCYKKYEGGYFGGADDLQVMWLPEGTHFKINEYDGSESIELKEKDDWIIA
jgi:hypothetical protein